jgi:hypothetical protein
MKIIALGDTHGRNNWKAIAEKELATCDKFIFIGDYFDSHDEKSSGDKQIENFKEILELKKANPDKVVLLTGNHDYHYIRGIGETYSGYQAGYALQIGELVEQAIKDGYLQMAFLVDDFFFSHAGLTKTWASMIMGLEYANDDKSMKNINPQLDDKLVQVLNDYLVYQPRVFMFRAGERMSMTGDDISQGPIWVRPYSLSKDKIEGVWHVVGHTQSRRLGIVDEHQIILIDCLGETGEYLIIEDGKPRSSND